jgi:hypothetical protein
MIRNNRNTTVTEKICVGCGMPENSWKGNNGRGYLKGEETYCCRDCAEGVECTCGV